MVDNVMVGRIKQLDKSLKFYSGVCFTINNNSFVREERGNRQKCIGLKIKKIRDYGVNCKKWDCKLVRTVSALDMKYILSKTMPNKYKMKTNNDKSTIVLKVENASVWIKLK